METLGHSHVDSGGGTLRVGGSFHISKDSVTPLMHMTLQCHKNRKHVLRGHACTHFHTPRYAVCPLWKAFFKYRWRQCIRFIVTKWVIDGAKCSTTWQRHMTQWSWSNPSTGRYWTASCVCTNVYTYIRRRARKLVYRYMKRSFCGPALSSDFTLNTLILTDLTIITSLPRRSQNVKLIFGFTHSA